MEPLENVIVLGAGASYVHGAPLTKDLLPYFFKHCNHSDIRGQVITEFLKDVFNYNVRDGADVDFPNIVDLLSLVDIAIDKHEELAKQYDNIRLSEVREALGYAIYKALEDSLSFKRGTTRSTVTRDLVNKLAEDSTAIISLNYDVIVDIAIARKNDDNFKFNAANIDTLINERSNTGMIDYGVNFANTRKEHIDGYKLYKIHGSFNWLWSKVSGNLYFGGLNKSIGAMYDLDRNQYYNMKSYYNSRDDNSFAENIKNLVPILITPTHLKDLRNPHIASVWRKAEEALRSAKRITFIGYSMPADDIYIKYLVKRAIETSDEPKQITVVDYSEETEDVRTEVENNYKRTLGSNIQYYRHGFEKYVKDEM